MSPPELTRRVISFFYHSWANNCAANAATNGVDRGSTQDIDILQHRPKHRPKGIARLPSDAIGLPAKFQPSLPQVNGNASNMVSYLLPDGITGVVSHPTCSTSSY